MRNAFILSSQKKKTYQFYIKLPMHLKINLISYQAQNVLNRKSICKKLNLVYYFNL